MILKLAQIEVIAGRPDLNFEKIKSVYLENESQADIVVFPEMALPGYLISDLWEDADFLADCMSFAEDLKSLSTNCLMVFGSVVQEFDCIGEDGRPRRFNSALMAQRGAWIQNPAINSFHFPKSLMPNYREFDDSRYFYDLRKLALERNVSWESLVAPVRVDFSSLKAGESKPSSLFLAPILCEDSWDHDYAQAPSDVLVQKGAQILINLSCSPYTHDKFQKRNRLLSAQAQELDIPIVYVNNVGIQNNGKTLFSFDGRSAFYTSKGGVFAKLEAWEEGIESFEIDFTQGFELKSLDALIENPLQAETLLQKQNAILYALKSHMNQSGLKRVVIGASGGVDSCLSAALFAKILPPEDIYLVNMPSRYNSQTTISIAQDLARNIGCWYMEVPIEDSVELTKAQIDGARVQRISQSSDFEESVKSDNTLTKTLHLSSFHLENVQARDRSARVLSAIASAVGGVYPSNANKAETMVGYSTLYGDHGGFIVPLGDLWKEEVFAMCRLMNELSETEVIPQKVFEIPPSAELSDKQDVDAGLGDPLQYDYHDRLFHSWMQSWNRTTPTSILNLAIKGELSDFLCLPKSIDNYFKSADAFIEDLERWWKLFKGMGVVKRVQAPTIVAVSRRSFGYDYRESIMSVYMGRNYASLREKFLSEGQKWFQG